MIWCVVWTLDRHETVALNVVNAKNGELQAKGRETAGLPSSIRAIDRQIVVIGAKAVVLRVGVRENASLELIKFGNLCKLPTAFCKLTILSGENSMPFN